jgi:diacylglycerol kinase family enzyme
MAAPSALVKRRRFLVLANPHASGGANTALTTSVVAALRRAGASVDLIVTNNAAEAEALARDAGDDVDCVVVAGGDGAARRVAGALGGRIPMGLIPTGAANVLAEEIGLPRAPHAIARTLLSGEARPVALARANGAPFLVIAGIGFSGAAASAAAPLKRSAGAFAYWAGIAWAAATAPGRIVSVDADGERSLARGVFATNARLRRRSLVDRGQDGMSLVLFDADHPPARAAIVAAIAAGRLETAPGVRIAPFRTATITGETAACQIDGDPHGTTPVTIIVDPTPVRVVMPALAV